MSEVTIYEDEHVIVRQGDDSIRQYRKIKPDEQIAIFYLVIDKSMQNEPTPTEDPTQTPQREMTPIELEISKIKGARVAADQVIQDLRAMVPTPERNVAIVKFQEGIMWLGMDLKRIKAESGVGENPYPESYNPASTRIEPTADNLKM